jgi:mRNA interferase YafQ
MLRLVTSSRFRKDLKRSHKRGFDLEKIDKAITVLQMQTSLSSKYRDHSLSGEYAGYRELHIEPDWLLIYFVSGSELHLIRTGTHADLFKE